MSGICNLERSGNPETLNKTSGSWRSDLIQAVAGKARAAFSLLLALVCIYNCVDTDHQKDVIMLLRSVENVMKTRLLLNIETRVESTLFQVWRCRNNLSMPCIQLGIQAMKSLYARCSCEITNGKFTCCLPCVDFGPWPSRRVPSCRPYFPVPYLSRPIPCYPSLLDEREL